MKIKLQSLIPLLVSPLIGCQAFQLELPPDMGAVVTEVKIDGTSSTMGDLRFGGNATQGVQVGQFVATPRPGGFDLGIECERIYSYAFKDAASTLWEVECKAESSHRRDIRKGLSDTRTEGLQCQFKSPTGDTWSLAFSGPSGGGVRGKFGGAGSQYNVGAASSTFIRKGFLFAGANGTVSAVQRGMPPTWFVGEKLPAAHKGPMAAAAAALVLYEDRASVYNRDACIYDE